MTTSKYKFFMEQVVVMNYCVGEVWIYNLPKLQMTSVEIEDWLDSMGHRESEIEWMVAPHIEINDERR